MSHLTGGGPGVPCLRLRIRLDYDIKGTEEMSHLTGGGGGEGPCLRLWIDF